MRRFDFLFFSFRHSIRFDLGTYFPRKEVSVEEQIKAVILKTNEAVRLRAKKEMTDRDGIPRETGEEWLNRTVGSYLPLAYEEVVTTVKAYVLTDKVKSSRIFFFSPTKTFRFFFRKLCTFELFEHLPMLSDTNDFTVKNGSSTQVIPKLIFPMFRKK